MKFTADGNHWPMEVKRTGELQLSDHKKVLILGASSYIGKHMFEALGTSKAICTHKSNPVSGSFFFDATRMRLSEILPRDLDVSHALILYAETRIDACKADIKRSYEINVRSTKSIIEDLVQYGIKPIFMSSEYVFDGEKGNYTEEDDPNPITVYGSQKLEIEDYIAQHCEDFAILRLAKVFSTDPEDGTILSNWLRQIRSGEDIRCARDQVFSPIHIGDVIAVSDAVIRQNLTGLFHVSNTESCSRLGMLRTLLDCLGANARVVECSIQDFDFIDRRPLNLSMNPRRVMEATGLEFRTIRECCEEISNRIGGTQPSTVMRKGGERG